MIRPEHNRVRRIGIGILLLLAAVFVFSASATAENLLENGSFEELDAEGMPVGWYTDAYLTDEGYTVFTVEEDEESPDGGNVVSIQNVAMNDARFAQQVAVEPETLYCFSGYIRAEGVEEGRGGNLSIEGLYAFSESIYDTDGEWEYIEWYGETGEDQTSVTLFIRLGGYSGESRGRVWFDGLELAEADEVPGDEIADLWYKQRVISRYDEDADEDADENEASPAWPMLILIAVVYAVVSLLLMSRREDPAAGLTSPGAARRSGITVLIALGAALLVRMILSAMIEGYMVDVNCFLSWGRTMATYGPVGFYPQTSFCDYPPAYTWVLGLNSLVAGWLGASDAAATRVVFRFVPSLCDVAACWLLRRFALGRNADRRSTDLFCILLAFNPVLIINSAAWGQMDSALCLCLMMVALFALEGKWQLALPCYMLAVLIKPQALMLGFLGLAATVLAWIREKESRKRILIGLGAAAGVALIIVVPFSIQQAPDWLITQYAGTLASYPYATVNTANFYYLAGGNWNAIGNAAPVYVPILLAVFAAGYAAAWILQVRKERKRLWIEAGLTGAFIAWFIFCAASGASWALIGAAAMAFAFLIVLSLYLRKGEISFLPYLGALLFILLYVFGVKMHERYIFPAFFLLVCAWAVHRDRRILILLLTLSATVFVNEGIVLDNSIRLGSAQGHLNNDTKALADILSAVNVLAAFYAVQLAIALGRKEPKEPVSHALFREAPADNRLHWKKRDTAILAALIAVYSLICFPTLGSTKAPQTAWTSTDYDESVTIDLGEYRESFCMLYFARVSRYDFTVSVSDDGENWDEESWAEMAQGQCWKWKYVSESFEGSDGTTKFNSAARKWFSGRYVRLTANQIGLALCEVIFRDGEGNILPATIADRSGAIPDSSLFSDPAALLDEQDSMEALPLWFPSELKGAGGEENPSVAQPGWWNSTYFDEIYHARTAYEFLHGTSPYETSHPPLGKILMSWGVAVFGMTPFGWRFAGALAGVAMLAGMYLLGKQLTKSTAISAAMGAMMALDCMHLTQTQIATIDSFPVLFILFSWFFMLRFTQTDLKTEKTARMLTDLGLGGFFMGLSIASKWIGIYSGAGLAVMFFTHCVRYLISERRSARQEAALPETAETERKQIPAAKAQRGRKPAKAAAPRTAAKEAGRGTVRRLPGGAVPLTRVLRLCLWCVLFFIAVPAVIYLLSYIPYFAYKHTTSLPAYLKDVWNAQTGMFNYHATPGLGMDHPFYSPWYEWPVIGKPMYYSTKMYVYNTEFSHSIFCIGNPVIWWTALGTLLLCAIGWIQGRMNNRLPVEGRAGDIAFGTENGLFFLLAGFLAQYLPWMLVPRGTYIYHYFASVPFLITSLGLVIHQVRVRYRTAGRIVLAVFLLLCAAAFILFLPYASGMSAPIAWLEAGKRFLKIWY